MRIPTSWHVFCNCSDSAVAISFVCAWVPFISLADLYVRGRLGIMLLAGAYSLKITNSQ